MILIGTPCYNGTVTTNYMVSLFNMIRHLDTEGIHADIMTPSHESLITRARNFIANEFVRQTEYTHLLFIDADMGFPPETAARFLKADKDVVCGIYPVKHLDSDKLRGMDSKLTTPEAEAAAMGYAVKFQKGVQPDGDGFVSVEYGATGFMLIKREVLTRMAGAYPELKYHYSYAMLYDHMYDNCAFFDTMIDPETNEYLPEDFSFCKRWRAMGGEVHADLQSRFQHVGTQVYRGDYPAFMAYTARNG